MRINYFEINRKKYPLCCGLKALSKIQKHFKTLDNFTNSFIIFSKFNDVSESDTTMEEPDIEDTYFVLHTLMEYGAMAAGSDMSDDEEIEKLVMQDLTLCALTCYNCVLDSMVPDEKDDTPKNVQSQTE